MENQTEKIPPHDNDAELMALGSMLLGDADFDPVPEITSILTDADFYCQEHRDIFNSIQSVYERTAGTDVTLVKREIQLIGRQAKKAAENLAWAMNSVGSAVNAKYYAENVRDMALRRAYISAGTHLVTQAYDNTIPMDDLSNQADEIIHISEKVATGVICLDTVETEPVHWLWFNRLPLGKLSVLAGDPNLGKSFVSLSMASYISAGMSWPDTPHETNPSGKVMLLSAEDGNADTIKPRLEAMSADCQNIVAFDNVLDIGNDIAKIERAIKMTEGVRLFVIDPVSAFIGTKRDGHSNTEIRAILSPLAKLAEKYRVAILCVTHLNKGGPAEPIYRVMGSLAWAAAARTVWTIVKEKNPLADPLCKVERRLLLPVKNNLACDSRTGMAFSIMDGRVVWEPAPIQTTAAEYFTQHNPGKPGPKPTAREEAERWILDTLSDGPMWASDLEEKAEQDGISWITVKRAKREAGVISEQHRANNKSRWFWRTEEQEGPPSDE